MNNVSLVGRITKEPELRATQNGNNTTAITVAVNRNFTNANGEREADFINCTVWNKQAENVCKYCSKGSLVGVTGRIQTRSYDGQDGKKVYVTEVVADNVTFLDTKKENEETKEKSNSQIVKDVMTEEDPFSTFAQENPIDDDSLPF